jgi:poly-gamma-glutamate capsule biosynthesis protein CapA/YwtB (metallophosphatase superfamily)
MILTSPAILEDQRLQKILPGSLPVLLLHDRREAGPVVRLCAVGDIGLSGAVALQAQAEGFDGLWAEIAPLLQAADLAFANLESPLVALGRRPGLFAGPTSGAKALARAGFDLLNLANNHIYDYGPEGLASTLQACEQAGLKVVGAGERREGLADPLVIEAGGLRLVWLGCARTLQKQSATGPFFWELDEQALLSAVRSAKGKGDLLVLSLHVGRMYLDYPDPDHRRLAQTLLENGADLVLMHHAHVLQGIEIQGGSRVACYSLGNFLIDWREGWVPACIVEEQQREGGVFLFELDREGIKRTAVLPTYIDSNLQVRWAVGEKGTAVLHRLERISLDLKGNYLPWFNRQRAERNIGHLLAVLWFHLRRGAWNLFWPELIKVRPHHLALLFAFLSKRMATRYGRLSTKTNETVNN